MPRLVEFSNMLDKLLTDNNDVKECIRAFDTTMCKKVNKPEMKVLREDLEKRFIHVDKWTDVQVQFDLMQMRFVNEKEKLQKQFTDSRNEEEQLIGIKCEELMKTRF